MLSSASLRLGLLLAMLSWAATAVADDPPKVERLSKSGTPTEKIMIGEAEHIGVPLIGAVFKARIDTGATTTSIFATDVKEFERDGKPWVRFVVRNDDSGDKFPLEAPVARVVEIKKRGQEGFTRRPAIAMDLIMGEMTKEVKVNLADRTGFEFPLLIGRDFLSGLAVVDVTLSYTQETPGAPTDEEKKSQ